VAGVGIRFTAVWTQLPLNLLVYRFLRPSGGVGVVECNIAIYNEARISTQDGQK
jgi:hypothetical protein